MRAPAVAKAAPVAVIGGPRRAFAGTGTLVRLFLRRDRVRIPLWVLGVVGFTVGSAASLAGLITTAAERQSRAQLMATPTFKALRGPGYGLDDYTTGAMVAHELWLFAALAAAAMSLLIVVRHTRAEEEAGRAELLRSSVVGAYAVPVAALLVAGTANLVLATTMAVALRAGVSDLDAVGAVAFASAVAAVGVVFAAVAVVAAQITEHARGAVGIAALVLGAAFALRAIGDTRGVGDRALSWASPIGWAQSVRPFVDERWWPLLLCVLLAAALAVAALWLADRRDVGAGLVRPRPGSPTASATLARPAGLALRLHRSSILAWGTGLAVLGAAFGAVVGEIEAFLADNPQMEEVLGAVEGGALLDAFLAMVVLILALCATGYAVGAALRLRSEETEGRAEPLIAASLPRHRWASAHLLVVLAGSAVVMLAGTAAFGTAAAAEQGDPALLTDLVLAGSAYLPAVWVTVGVVVALFGALPRATVLAWLLLALAVVVGLLGDLLGLPDAVRALSPLHHVPELPEAPAAGPLLVLLAVAAGLMAAGLAGFARRDVDAT